jgi:hypothetical protein
MKNIVTKSTIPPLPMYSVISLRHYRGELQALPPSTEVTELIGHVSAVLAGGVME